MNAASSIPTRSCIDQWAIPPAGCRAGVPGGFRSGEVEPAAAPRRGRPPPRAPPTRCAARGGSSVRRSRESVDARVFVSRGPPASERAASCAAGVAGILAPDAMRRGTEPKCFGVRGGRGMRGSIRSSASSDPCADDRCALCPSRRLCSACRSGGSPCCLARHRSRSGSAARTAVALRYRARRARAAPCPATCALLGKGTASTFRAVRAKASRSEIANGAICSPSASPTRYLRRCPTGGNRLVDDARERPAGSPGRATARPPVLAPGRPGAPG